jgi:hypothetical protein
MQDVGIDCGSARHGLASGLKLEATLERGCTGVRFEFA